MRSALIEKPGTIGIVDVADRAPGADEVRVRTDLVGVCATDVHILRGEFPTAAYPVRPGHEATGIVTDVGPGVHELCAGDRVILDPGCPCLRCSFCRDGRTNLCEARRAFGIDLPGAAAETFTVPQGNLFRANGIDARTAVLGEPLACVVHALDLVGVATARNVLVYGAGTIGLLALQVLNHYGSASVTVVDRIEQRLALARLAGASHATMSIDSAPLTDFDLVIDATGVAGAIADGLERLRRGGTFLQIGVAAPETRVPLAPYLIFSRELKVQGSMTTRFSFPRAIELLASGAIDPSLITDEPWPLADIAEAIAASGSGSLPKVLVGPNL